VATIAATPHVKLALDQLPDGAALCLQPTISRLENRRMCALLRITRAMVGLYCGSFRQVPRRLMLDVHDTFDAVHGGHQLRLYDVHEHEYGFQPIAKSDGQRRPDTAEQRIVDRLSATDLPLVA
jgi:hypothetical protein